MKDHGRMEGSPVECCGWEIKDVYRKMAIVEDVFWLKMAIA